MATLTRRVDQPFMSLRDAMNQLIAESFTPMLGSTNSHNNGAESLPMNLYEDGEKFYLALQAPGVDPQALEITAANGVLTVAARRESAGREGWRTLWQESGPAEYRRQVRLPIEFDANGIEASYENGLLWLTIPKAEHVKPKTIKVQVGK
jgi:HSP20 family protein